jgi:RNA polymerase sigma factor (sigma-70 family)
MSDPCRRKVSPEARAATGSRGSSPVSLDDRWNSLMAAAQGGDDLAYERLMAEIRQWLSRYFHKRLPPPAAQDATQEALLAIHTHKQKYLPNDPMTPWLKTIARFKWMDQLRGHMRSPDSLDDIDVPVADHGAATRSSILLDRLLAEVKPAQEQVIRLVKLHGASIEEASRISGQSASLVKVNIHRGLKRIAQALNSPGDRTIPM